VKAKKGGHFRRNVLLVLLFLVVLLGGAYVAAHFLAGDTLPRNASVLGVKIGGLTPAQAEASLRTQLAPKAEKTITLNVEKEAVEFKPEDYGLGIDYERTIQDAGGGEATWNPIQLVSILFGGFPQDPVTTHDDAKIDAKLAEIAKDVDTPAVDESIVFDGTTPKLDGKAKDGLALDVKATRKAILDAYLKADSADAVIADKAPEVTKEMAEKTLKDFAEPAVAGNISVAVGDKGNVNLTPEVIADALTFKPEGDKLVPVFDAQKLGAGLDDKLVKLGLKAPVNAKFEIAGKKSGKPKIVPSVDGKGIDTEELVKNVTAMIESKGARKVSVGIADRPATFTEADAEKMGVKEITGEFTTYFPGSAYRYNNIGKAASKINGTYLAPGETFSMNKCLGKRTPEAGWMKGGGIANGRVDPNIYGGGISQSTTTTFNAIFFAGLEDVYHHPHTLWFSRYPKGREATLDWDSIDMKFKNDTEYGVLLQAWITGKTGEQGSVTVRVWSTKIWDVKASKPVVSNYRYPGATIYDTSAGCIPQDPMEGFDVKYQRLFYKDGKLVKTQDFKWSYDSLTKVVCGKKP
jgi:vancomycin resistance protein YoaR